jgi:phosphoribosylformylglycinamidine synthase
VKGVGDACRALKLFGGDHPLPIVSGNVSLYNQSASGQAIAPTPIVACAGRLDDASRARGFALKQVGSRLVLLGKLHAELGGSEYERFFGNHGNAGAPQPDFDFELSLVRVLNAAFAKRLILAAHDISLGGLLVTVAEMAIASEPFDIGASLDVRGAEDAALFSEMGGVVVEMSDDAWTEMKALVEKHGVTFIELGVTADGTGLAADTAAGSFSLTMNQLRTAHAGRLAEVLYG